MAEPLRLYQDKIALYESVHYSHGEDEEEVGQILGWFHKPGARVLDLGCGTGLHALCFAEKGFKAVGLDKSAEAVEMARGKTYGMKNISFEVADIEEDLLAPYGVQDLVISLGNTISHLRRGTLVLLFDRIRRALAPGGVFVFNAFYWAQPLQKSFVERDASGAISVIWEREINEVKGTMLLKGHFLKESYTQNFEVHCYKVPEMMNLMASAGLKALRWSHRLNFKGRLLPGANTVFYRGVSSRG